MVEYIPYFAGLIMVLFGIAFYSAMLTFRKMTEEKPVEAEVIPGVAGKDKPEDPKHN